MNLIIRNIRSEEINLFASILSEGARWLSEVGMEMWREDQVTAESLLKHSSINEMYIGFINEDSAAVMLLQEKDDVFWPEDQNTDVLYLHKLCVRRKFAKTGLSHEMIQWAKTHAKGLNKSFLKLDCAADRPRLCEFYTKQGFQKVKEQIMFGKYPTAFFEYPIP